MDIGLKRSKEPISKAALELYRQHNPHHYDWDVKKLPDWEAAFDKIRVIQKGNALNPRAYQYEL